MKSLSENMKYRRLLVTSCSKIAIFWNRLGSRGKKRRLRPQTTWRRTVNKRNGKMQGGVYGRARGRSQQTEKSVKALCAMRHEEDR